MGVGQVSDRALSRGRGAAVSDRSFCRGGVMANMGVTSHVWLLSTRNVAGETEGKQFHFMELELRSKFKYCTGQCRHRG